MAVAGIKNVSVPQQHDLSVGRAEPPHQGPHQVLDPARRRRGGDLVRPRHVRRPDDPADDFRRPPRHGLKVYGRSVRQLEG